MEGLRAMVLIRIQSDSPGLFAEMNFMSLCENCRFKINSQGVRCEHQNIKAT